MAQKLAFTLALLSLFFAFALAREPADGNQVAFLDLSDSRPEFDSRPTLLLPSERPIYEPNTEEKPVLIDNGGLIAGELGEIVGGPGAEEEKKAVEAESDSFGAEEEDQKAVDDEKDDVVEAEQEDLKRPVAVARFWPVHGHFRRPCHHWMKRMMRMRAMRHPIEGRHMPYGNEMGEFRGDERRGVEEEEQKPVDEEEQKPVEEEDQKATEPKTQTLDLTRQMTGVRFPLVNHHFHHGCRHHLMKHMMRMRHQMHGHEMPYGHDMILGGGERKEFDRDFFRGVERKEVDPEMGEFPGDERKEIDMRMFRGGEGDVHEMRPRWMGHHHHHYHHHHDHEGRPWFPSFSRHHHHDHENEKFTRQSSGRPFFRHEGDEEEREEGGLLDRIRGFIANHF